MKNIIYYTDNRIGKPIIPIVQKELLKAGLPIISVSLKPIDFGENIVLEEEKRSYPTMIKQIILGLEASKADYVFFCEHDCLYPKSHFYFTPPRDDIFYYNSNVWRWKWQRKYNNDPWDHKAITYDRMLPLSVMCANRKLVLDHYKMRQRKIKEWGLSHFRSREPRLARLWGYEPGTKKKKRGGLTDDDFDTWYSRSPVIDIRHKWSFSRPKVTLDKFKHKPKNWQEIPIEKIPYWNLKELFNL
jgi:hypothetical protein